MKKPVALLAAVALAGGLYAFVPKVRLLVWKAAGRSPHCPLANALGAADNLRWQIFFKDELLKSSKLIEKDPAGYHLWETPMGRWWIPEGDDWTLPFNLAEQKRNIYGTGERAVQAGDVVLDCGASVGVFTRVALGAGARTVVAIEPGPENVEALHRNFRPEIAAGRVIVVPKGVWDKEDVLTLKRDTGNTAADTFVMDLKKSAGGIQVPLTTIDKLVAELNLPRVDYIKMDIEGSEQRAITGALATLAKWRPRLALSAYHLPEDPVRIPELVLKGWAGYRMECGPCEAGQDRRIRPDVLYFR